MTNYYPFDCGDAMKVPCSNCGKEHLVYLHEEFLRDDGINPEITICSCGQTFQIRIINDALVSYALPLERTRKIAEAYWEGNLQ